VKTLLLLLLLAPATQAADLENLITAELPGLISFYKDLHAHPELAFHEKRTGAKVAKALKKAGFTVTTGFGSYTKKGRVPTGVVGVLRNGEGPTVLLRADMDALPVTEATELKYASKVKISKGGKQVGVMHACGHDAHTSVLVGAAKVLAQARKRWQGTLIVIGQPAEEAGAGARSLLADGLYTKTARPDYAFAFHVSPDLPAGAVGYHTGYTLANTDSVDITVRGKPGHGAFPQNTVDPIVLASRLVLALQTIVSREVEPLKAAVISVGEIHAGTRRNLIPAEVQLRLTVRTYENEVRTKVLAAIERTARGIADSAGAPAPVVTVRGEGTPAVYNDPPLTRRLAGAFKKVLGQARVIETGAVMGGEDFGRYGLKREVPISMFWLGATESERLRKARAGHGRIWPLHSPGMRIAPKATLSTGVQAMALAVIELLPAAK
jgi:amidohydrolase